MTERILVINPNSSEAVTRGVDAAMAPLRLAGGPAIECATLAEGPPGIETQAHVEGVTGPLARLIAARDNDCAAFVIACFSDPGLHLARETTRKPVLGIAECGILTALTLGERFGVVAILERSIPRHLRYVCLLAAPEGVRELEGAHPDVPIYTAAIDSHLNEHGYIVPGLGDAGDRLFGTK